MEVIKIIFRFCGKLGSYILPTISWEIWPALVSHIYTGFLSRHFHKMGKGVLIAYPPYLIKGMKYISIGNNVTIESGIQLTAVKRSAKDPSILIGNNCFIRRNCHITAINSIVIGDNLLTGTNVLISDNSHGTASFENCQINPYYREVVSKGPVTIGKNVWLGNNVCVLAGTNIGDGVIIGANSVVTTDIPPYCVAAGIPAKIIKKLQ